MNVHCLVMGFPAFSTYYSMPIRVYFALLVHCLIVLIGYTTGGLFGACSFSLLTAVTGMRSRNKVSVGEPAKRSFAPCWACVWCLCVAYGVCLGHSVFHCWLQWQEWKVAIAHERTLPGYEFACFCNIVIHDNSCICCIVCSLLNCVNWWHYWGFVWGMQFFIVDCSDRNEKS